MSLDTIVTLGVSVVVQILAMVYFMGKLHQQHHNLLEDYTKHKIAVEEAHKENVKKIDDIMKMHYGANKEIGVLAEAVNTLKKTVDKLADTVEKFFESFRGK